MKKSSWVAIILIVVLCAGLVIVKSASRPAQTDVEQIHTLLVKGQTAVEKKDLKAAMSCISKNYRVGEMKYDHIRVQAIQAFQQEGKYKVLLENPGITVSGDQATATPTVTVSMVSHGSLHRIFSQRVTIHLAKENSMHWLVIPSKNWKITGMEGIPVAGME